MGLIDDRLQALGIDLPEAVKPVANYIPYVQSGNLLHMSGQIPLVAGKALALGQLGDGVNIDLGQACARQCAINLLVQMKAACGGDLSRVKRIVKLTCFVASAAHFVDLPKVANGASDLMVEVFGEAGRHARSTVGVAALPLDVPVEVEALVEVA